MESRTQTNPIFLCVLAALVMAYGWGYRGIVGHEGGAMVPGALLGLAVCLGTARADWHRRAAVAGLCGAVGWAWGGSFSYMEQTLYTVSDSFLDVLYGYSVLFLLGGLWAGIGGAVLGLAFTLPRSHLQRLADPLTAIAAVFLLTYGAGLLFPKAYARLGDFTAVVFDDSDWFAASTVMAVSGVYFMLRPNERAEAALFFACGACWWLGYLGFTKFGGIQLGPPFRSESWGGVVGILAVLLLYLARQRNRAALMLGLYGLLGGGIAFALAVFVRHPVRVEWGPFALLGGTLQWKIAEESFGLFMGLAIALGVWRLAQGGLAPAAEDVPRKPLDLYAAFVLLVAIMWMNLRRGPERWVERYHVVPETVAGVSIWAWFFLGGLALSVPVLYALYLCARDRLYLLPERPHAKGSLLLLLVLWVTVFGGFAQMLPGAKEETFPLVDATFVGFAAVVTLMLLSQHRLARAPATTGGVPSSDPRWNVGLPYGLVWVGVPAFLVLISMASMAMQDGPASRARLRFGPEAYWREASRIMGTWDVLGRVDGVEDVPVPDDSLNVAAIEFRKNQTVAVSLRTGETLAPAHRWRHTDSVVWLDWNGLDSDSPGQAALGMAFAKGMLYIPWPPEKPAGFLVLERRGDQ